MADDTFKIYGLKVTMSIITPLSSCSTFANYALIALSSPLGSLGDRHTRCRVALIIALLAPPTQDCHILDSERVQRKQRVTATESVESFEQYDFIGGRAEDTFEVRRQRSVDQQLWNKTLAGLLLVCGQLREFVCVDQRGVFVRVCQMTRSFRK